MRVISDLYFVGKLYLPNVTTATGQVSGLTQLQSFIGIAEVEYLEAMFGYELSKVIIAAIDEFIAHATPIEVRIVNILTGAEFTDYSGRLQKWKGLTRTELISPIAGYVYYGWQKDHASQSVIGGEVINEVENSTNVGSAQKICSNWNDAVSENRILMEFMRVNYSVYPEYHNGLYFGFSGGYMKRKELLTNINEFGI